MPETWYAVIKSATGEAVSFGTSVGENLPRTLEVVEVDHQPQRGERWDATTRSIVSGGLTETELKRDRLDELRALSTRRTAEQNAELDSLRRDLLV